MDVEATEHLVAPKRTARFGTPVLVVGRREG